MLILKDFSKNVLRIFQEFTASILSIGVCHPCYQYALQHVQLLVVELVIYCKKYCLTNSDVVSTLYKPTSDFVSFSTSNQCYFNVDPQR